jgi:uridylate kinase
MATYSTQKVLELACAAYRLYGDYLKEPEYKYDSEGKFLFVKHANKELVKHALGITKYSNTEQEFRPMDLILSPEDAVEAEEIIKFYRRLMFSAVKGKNEFETEVNALLESEEIEDRKVGYIACLPHIYRRDKAKNTIEKRLKNCDNEPIAEEGSTILDKDCDILRVKRSTNFDAWNVLAIIDNKIASWMSSKEIKVGDAVIVKAKVKGIAANYQNGKTETRLNYVKVAQ